MLPSRLSIKTVIQRYSDKKYVYILQTLSKIKHYNHLFRVSFASRLKRSYDRFKFDIIFFKSDFLKYDVMFTENYV